MSTLREVQAAFARGLLDPALAGGITDDIVGAGITPARRLAIYRNNVSLSLRRVLEGAFPASRRLLGPERFTELAQAFIRKAPPDRPQLMAYGAGFPAFLEHATGSAAVPHIGDVARLEWACEEAYHAADAAPLAPAALAALPIERYPELRFELHPSLRLIRSAGPVYAIWRKATNRSADELEETPPGAGPEQVLVVRPEMTVITRPVAAADLILVEAVGEGLPLAQAAARAQAADPGFDLQTALALHLTSGSFAACG